MVNAQLGGSMFSGAAKNFLGNAAGPLAGLASAPILAHALGVDGRGAVAGATAPLLLLATVAAIGIPDAVTYFVARHIGHRNVVARRAIGLVLVSGLLATGLAVFVAPILSGGNSELTSLINLASIAILPTILVGVFRAIAAGQGKWALVALERALGPIIRVVAVAGLALLGELDVWSATASIAFAPIFAGLVYLFLRAVPASVAMDPPRYSEIFGYSSRAWLGSIAGVILMRIDQVVMVPLSSTHELGLYAVAVTVGELPLVVNTAVREVVFAADARSSDDKALTRAARLSFFVCLVIAVLMGVSCNWWIPVVFGPNFADAVPATLVLLAAVIIGVPGSVAGAALGARGMPQLRSYSLVVACVLNLSLMLILVPDLGAFGAAIATLFGNLVSSNLNILQMKIKCGISIRDFYVVRVDDLRLLKAKLMQIMRRN